MDNLLRFHIFQALDDLGIDDVNILDKVNQLIELQVQTRNKNLTPICVDSLLRQNDPELHRRYLFQYKIVKS